MSARERILARVRNAAPREVAHPGAFASRSGDASWSRFARASVEAGGQPSGPHAPTALTEAVRWQCEAWGGGRVVVQPAAAALLEGGGWEVADADVSPHSFEDVAVGVACGCVCVAENGAVGVPARLVSQRALLFLCERLILIAPAKRVAIDMHDATRLMREDLVAQPSFLWIAGPSKTADIEQTLVVGAHGPRALAVLGVTSSIEE